MNNHPTSDNYQKTLSFSPFVSGVDRGPDETSTWKRAVLRLIQKSLRWITPSFRTVYEETAARPGIISRPVSRYEVDVYGQPRILSRWEVVLYALAKPVVIGAVIGFGLAISILAIHKPSMLKPQAKAAQSLVQSQEAEP